MLSQKARYALRALTALAELEPGAQAQIAEIADEARVPRKFLEQILLDLKKRGLVHSTRGKLGGYTLGRPASEIELAEVIRTIDGPLALSPCASRMAYRKCDDCLDADTCPIRKVLTRSARRNGRHPREPQRREHDREARVPTSQDRPAKTRLAIHHGPGITPWQLDGGKRSGVDHAFESQPRQSQKRNKLLGVPFAAGRRHSSDLRSSRRGLRWTARQRAQ